MAKKMLTRVQNKHDIEANWKQAVNFTPLVGEIIVYDPDEAHAAARFKIGDGQTNVNDLSFGYMEDKTLGFYIYSVDVSQLTIVLSLTRAYDEEGNPQERVWNEEAAKTLSAWSQNDLLNYDVGTTYTMRSKFNLFWGGAEGQDGIIEVDYLPFDQTTIDAKLKSELNGTSMTIYNVNKPKAGAVLAGQYTFAQGVGSIAAGHTSVALNRDTKAFGNYSFAQGRGTTAGYGAMATGFNNSALGNFSHTEGTSTYVDSLAANGHAEGHGAKVYGEDGHAEGESTEVRGNWGHAEGLSSVAHTKIAHAEGEATHAYGIAAHTEGKETQAGTEIVGAMAAHAEGYRTKVYGTFAHSEGEETEAHGEAAHTEGYQTYASKFAHAEGENTDATGQAAHSEGYATIASGKYAHAEGQLGQAAGIASHTEGNKTIAQGNFSHTEGNETQTAGSYTLTNADNPTTFYGESAHAEGKFSKAYGNESHAEGTSTTAVGRGSHSEGHTTVAEGDFSHVEGNGSKALGAEAHAEGVNTIAHRRAHAEGFNTVAQTYSHAEGVGTYAEGQAAHAEGQNTYATMAAQHVQGKYNEVVITTDSDGNTKYNAGNYAHVVGWGTESAPKNIHTLGTTGDAWFAGAVSIGADNKELATKEYVDNNRTDVVVDNILDIESNNPIANSTVASQINSIEASLEIAHIDINTTNEKIAKLPTKSYVDNSIAIKSGDAIYSGYMGTSEVYNTDALAHGVYTEAYGVASHSEGMNFTDDNGTYYPLRALGDASHAEGQGTIASGTGSHAEGFNTQATANRCHAEGGNSFAHAEYSHVEGIGTRAGLEGESYSWHENYIENTSSRSRAAHAEGVHTVARGRGAHAEGWGTETCTEYQHAQGRYNIIDGSYAHIVGNGWKETDGTITRSNAHTLDWQGNAWFAGNVTVGSDNKELATKEYVDNNSSLIIDDSLKIGSENAISNNAVALAVEDLDTFIRGVQTDASTGIEHAMSFEPKVEKLEEDVKKIVDNYATTKYVDDSIAGIDIPEQVVKQGSVENSAITNSNQATARFSFAQGKNTKAYGEASHAEGMDLIDEDNVYYVLEASGMAAHAEGQGTRAQGIGSHAEGFNTLTTANRCHAEGGNSKAHAEYSHAEGIGATAGIEGESYPWHENYEENAGLRARAAHAEGVYTHANARGAHAEGFHTIANKQYQHVQGKYNATGNYAHIVGNGDSEENRSNAYTLDWDGNATFAGNITTNGTTFNSAFIFEITYDDGSVKTIKVLGAEV